MSVIKANAYGHDYKIVAKALQGYTDWFAVATVREAIQIREVGITEPILVFEPPQPDRVSAYKAHNLTAVISDLSHFEILEEETKAHIECDTGMGRLGFLPEQLAELSKAIDVHGKRLNLEGLFTHFATADQVNSSFVDEQRKRLNLMKQHLPAFNLYYSANSSALLNYPEVHMNMVRHGIALYGYDPSETCKDLKPVMEWWAEIIQSRWIPKGWSVSYESTWKAPEDGYLAVIPVGYADGLSRNLSGTFEVQIEEDWYKTVGNITMDYVMVFTGAKKIPVGTEVLLMGGKRNDATILGKASGTIPYEILSRIALKVPRISR